MSDLAALLARVRAATGPDRELDAEIAGAFNIPHVKQRKNWTNYSTGSERHYSSITKIYAPYTASLDAVLALADAVLPAIADDISPGWDWIIGRTNGGLTIHAQFGDIKEFGNTPALAALSAVLSAKLSETPHE